MAASPPPAPLHPTRRQAPTAETAEAEAATEAGLRLQQIRRLVGQLALGLGAGFLLLIALGPVASPASDRPDRTVQLGLALLVLASVVPLAGRWRRGTAPRPLPLGLPLGLWALPLVLGLSALVSAWYGGVGGLWQTVWATAALTLLNGMRAGEAAASGARPGAAARRVPPVAIAWALVLILSAGLAWRGAAPWPEEAGMLLCLMASALATLLAWGSGLCGAVHRTPIAALRTRMLWALLIASAAAMLTATALGGWLQQHSRHWVDVGVLIGGIAAIFTPLLLYQFVPALRRMPVLFIAVWCGWALLAGQTHPTLLLAYMGFGSLALGLLAPARYWWLVSALFGVILTAVAMAPGVEPQPLQTLGAMNTLLFLLSLWLNRRLEALVPGGADGADGAAQGGPHVAADDLAAGRQPERPWVGLAMAGAVLILGAALIGFEQFRQARVRQAESVQIASRVAQQIQERWQSYEHLARLYAARAPADFDDQSGFEEAFPLFAAIASEGVVVQWAPDAVVRYVHPRAGNEADVGRDLRADPARRAAVEALFKGGGPRWSGPFALEQGGQGLALDMPVYGDPVTVARRQGAPAAVQAPRRVVGVATMVLKFPAALHGIVAGTPSQELHVAAGLGEARPVTVLGESAFVPAAQAAEPAQGLVATGSEARVRFQPLGVAGAVGEAAGEPSFTVTVRPVGDGALGEVQRGLQWLVILAAALGWLASLLESKHREGRDWLKRERAFSQMRQMFEHSVVGKLLFARDGSVLWSNDRATVALNASQAQVRATNCYQAATFRAQGWDQAIRATLSDGQNRSFDHAGPGPGDDEQRVDVRLTFSRVLIDGQPHALMQVLDLSDIRRIERALADTNAQLETLVERRTRALAGQHEFSEALIDTMGSIFVLLDAQGRVERFNQTAQSVTGFSLAEVRGRPVWERLIPPEAQPAARGVFDQLMHDRIVGYFENAWMTKSGERRLIAWHNTVLRDDAGQVTHAMAIGIDITEQRQLQDELTAHRNELEGVVAERTREIEQLRRRYQLLFDVSPDAYLLVDQDTLKLIAGNRAAAAMFGGTPEQLVGVPLLQISAPLQLGDVPLQAAAVELTATAIRQGHHRFEWIYRRLDGSDFWCEVSIHVLELDGKATIFAALRDITARRRIEADLRDARAAAEAASLARAQLLANTSHELRTPLNVSMGMLQLLEQGPLQPQQQDFVRRALTASRSLGRLVEDMLDFARIDAGVLAIVPEPFAVREALDEVVENLQPAARGKGLELQARLGAGLPHRLLGDGRRLGQIVTNLLTNAIKFTGQGRVDLSADWQPDPRPGTGEGRLIVEVRDTGVGMAPESLARIFERFYRVDPMGEEGVGIGLSITHGLVERMGGGIEVDSVQGQGSRFTVRLPMTALPDATDAMVAAEAVDGTGAADEPDATAATVVPDAANMATDRLFAGRPLADLHILVAEDNADNQLLTRALLEGCGATVHVAANGRIAVRYASEAAPRYDAILMDMRMPQMDGMAATRAIRAIDALRDIPIVALTANASPEDRRACTEAGMTAFLTKPLDGHELVRTLRGLCGVAPEGRDVRASAAPGPSPAAASGMVAPVPSPEGFDLAAALDRIGDNRAIYAAMAAGFLSMAEPQLARFEEALTAGDMGSAAGLLHSLRGSALSLGAEDLARTLRRTEDRLAQQPAPDSGELLTQVRQAMTQTCAGLAAIIDGLEA